MTVEMWKFLSEFTHRSDSPYDIVVMEEGGMTPPRQYRLHPQQVLYLWVASLATVTIFVLGLVTFTPLRNVVLGTGTAEMKQDARLNALRLAALKDSMATQERYVAQLQQLFSGELDSVQTAVQSPESTYEEVDNSLEVASSSPRSQNWSDHQQPAVSVGRVGAGPVRTVSAEGGDTNYLPSIQLPVLPPVQGFRTRGYDARTGHYAVDIAVEEGTVVRSIGDGYVILADWTHDGGYSIAVQHADGYVSVYKHNQRLLKHVGDRVRDREVVAVSGNSGEVTTGPHLHFELWQNGLAQDPSYYFIGW